MLEARCLLRAAAILLLSLPAASSAAADVVRVKLGQELAPAGTRGRVLLFMIDEGSRRLAGREPADAPFFIEPQPIASVAVAEFLPGMTVELGPQSVSWPRPLSELAGSHRVQAVFKCNPDEGSSRAEGNAYSEVRSITFDPAEEQIIELRLSSLFKGPIRTPGPHLRYVKLRSELLSSVRGRGAFLRAGVALPPGFDHPDNREKRWPAIYIIPGFGGRDTEAAAYATMLQTKGVAEIAPVAVHIVLDPEGPFGHHGFADSEANGPVGTALVKELIPHLEREFRLDPGPGARILTGHSSGGWASIWLSLTQPETFGACWASSPDPIDFSAFQRTDLYKDPSLFVMADGSDTPSFRTAVAPRVEKLRMTVREEIGIERAMAPAGDSGQQWGAWLAMFSSVDPTTRSARWVADPVSGTIDRGVVERDWSRLDLARLVEGRWESMRDLLPRIRLVVGEQDSFFLERAVRRFAERVVPRLEGSGALPPADPEDRVPPGEVRLGSGPGYIWIVPNASHDNIVTLTTLRWNLEMKEWLGQSQRRSR
jgi:hypothetical protein